MHTPFTSRSARGLLALAVILSVMAGGAFAAGVDTETTDTVTTSELRAGDTISTFDASNNETMPTLQFSATSTDPAVRFVDPDTGTVVTEFTNASSKLTQTGSASGTYYYNLSVNESALNNMPIEAGENKSVTVRLVDNETLSAENETMANITIYLDGVNDRTVRWIGDTEAQDATLDSDGYSVAGFNISVDEYVEVEQESVTFNGSASTATMHFANGSIADRFSQATADDAESGDWLIAQQVMVEGTPIKVYYDAAPDGVDDSTAYGVYEPGDDEIVVYAGEDTEDSTDLTMVGNQNYGIWTTIQHFGVSDVATVVAG